MLAKLSRALPLNTWSTDSLAVTDEYALQQPCNQLQAACNPGWWHLPDSGSGHWVKAFCVEGFQITAGSDSLRNDLFFLLNMP